MARGGLFVAVLIGLVAGLLFADLALKASNELRRYRPDGPRLSAPRHDKSPVFHARSFATKGQRNNG